MKEKMVTRTITKTSFTAVGINELTPDKVEERAYNMEGKLNAEQALKAAKKHSENSSYTPAMVKDIATTETVMGMTITDFMANAVEVERPASQKKQEKED